MAGILIGGGLLDLRAAAPSSRLALATVLGKYGRLVRYKTSISEFSMVCVSKKVRNCLFPPNNMANNSLQSSCP